MARTVSKALQYDAAVGDFVSQESMFLSSGIVELLESCLAGWVPLQRQCETDSVAPLTPPFEYC